MENKIVFLRGKKTIMRPYQKDTDLDLMTAWVNDPDVTRFITVWSPMTKDAENGYLQGATNDENMLLVIETTEGQPIGSTALHRIDWINRTAVTGTVIGNKEFWGKGYGTDAKMQLLHFAFNRMNLRAIRSSVIAYNVRSHKALLKQGYRQVGVFPKWFFRDGKYHDEILFVLTKKDFAPVWRAYSTK
ncbi:MAG: hypothetical protein AMXMBFR44_5350 [Candidatus Campbellbacteria bacterium]